MIFIYNLQSPFLPQACRGAPASVYKGKSENANRNRENGNLEQQKSCFFLMPQGLFQVIISNGFEMTRF